jgi:F-type H+-transporting ATPase subunit b
LKELSMVKAILRVLALAALLALPLARTHAAEEHAGTAKSATTSAAAEHTEELMPDPHKATTITSALWVIAIFLIVLAILYPTAWKNVIAGLKAREERIRNDIAAAEAARTRAEATLREYTAQLATAEQRARDTINAAAADAERIATQIRTRGEQEAQEIKERATREIDAARKEALAQVYEQTANLATSIAEKIIRKSLNVDDQRDLVARSLEQVQNIQSN